MPQVEFHSGVAQPLNFACRLLRKACRQRVPVLVSAPAPTLDALDRELWTFEALEFLPHRRWREGQVADAALRRTPIWLCEREPPELSCPVLLNIDGAAAPSGGAFERIIEIVATSADERQRGRLRWREYEARGWPIKHHAGSAG